MKVVESYYSNTVPYAVVDINKSLDEYEAEFRVVVDLNENEYCVAESDGVQYDFATKRDVWDTETGEPIRELTFKEYEAVMKLFDEEWQKEKARLLG